MTFRSPILLFPALLTALSLALLPSCAGPTLEWRPREAVEDPAPSGPAYLRAYKESHYRALGSCFEETTDLAAFVERVRSARVLFLGDHHEDRQLHSLQRRVIRALSEAGIQMVFALEAIGVEDEPAVRSYLAGEFDVDSLRQLVRTRWPGSWLELRDVDSFHYRELLEIARQTGTPVWGLEPTPRLELERRDPWIAARLRSLEQRVQNRLIVVVVGHAHLLGQGDLVTRTGVPAVVVGARTSVTLNQQIRSTEVADTDFVQTDQGVWFFGEQLRSAKRDMEAEASHHPRHGLHSDG